MPLSKIYDLNIPDYWFYVPEFSTVRGQLEVKCIDSSHVLTRTRRKLCKGGNENITNEPWIKVARQTETFVSSYGGRYIRPNISTHGINS
jgi:hypothetical protein